MLTVANRRTWGAVTALRPLRATGRDSLRAIAPKNPQPKPLLRCAADWGRETRCGAFRRRRTLTPGPSPCAQGEGRTLRSCSLGSLAMPRAYQDFGNTYSCQPVRGKWGGACCARPRVSIGVVTPWFSLGAAYRLPSPCAQGEGTGVRGRRRRTLVSGENPLHRGNSHQA